MVLGDVSWLQWLLWWVDWKVSSNLEDSMILKSIKSWEQLAGFGTINMISNKPLSSAQESMNPGHGDPHPEGQMASREGTHNWEPQRDKWCQGSEEQQWLLGENLGLVQKPTEGGKGVWGLEEQGNGGVMRGWNSGEEAEESTGTELDLKPFKKPFLW